MANEFKVRKGLIVYGSGSSPVLDVQGSQGQLFSITDSLSGSLFSVNDISGIPVMEAFSDNTVKIGTFGAEGIIVSGSYSYITGSVTGSFTGSLLGTASYSVQNISSSYAQTASFVLNAISSSFASTASYVNPLRQNVEITGSLNVSGSTIIKGGLTVDDANDGDMTFGSRTLSVNNTANPFYITHTNPYGGVIFNYGSSVKNLFAFGGDNDYTNGRIVMGNWGNVNYGNANSSSYDVPYGTFHLYSRTGENAFNITTQGGTANFLAHDKNNTGSLQNISFNTNAVYISSSGNVGFGTTTPSKRVEILDGTAGDGLSIVRSSVTSQRIELIPNDGTATALIKGGGNNKPFYIASWANGGTAQPLYFGTNYTTGTNEVRMTISTTGNVGIGNLTPSYRLDVSGSGNFTNNLIVTGSLTVSGSSTLTNIGPAIFSGSLAVTAGITGSLLGTASYVTTAESASYSQYSEYILNDNSVINALIFG